MAGACVIKVDYMDDTKNDMYDLVVTTCNAKTILRKTQDRRMTIWMNMETL
ncbi:MAG: hypothetical protein PHR50_02940 [Lachnospiraceae bacterium]|nr:hypothetical protein [Lachnospiraceae bacterium]